MLQTLWDGNKKIKNNKKNHILYLVFGFVGCAGEGEFVDLYRSWKASACLAALLAPGTERRELLLLLPVWAPAFPHPCWMVLLQCGHWAWISHSSTQCLLKLPFKHLFSYLRIKLASFLLQLFVSFIKHPGRRTIFLFHSWTLQISKKKNRFNHLPRKTMVMSVLQWDVITPQSKLGSRNQEWDFHSIWGMSHLTPQGLTFGQDLAGSPSL